jgi:hypothetical protein
LELESVFAAFERSLNSTARQLLLHFVELGTRRDVPEAHRARDRNTRLVQLLELDGPTWNTYASSSSRFFAYITDNDVHPAEVQSRHLADWVADEAARDDRYTLAPSSMAQAVSGVRAFLGAAHVRIPAANDDPDVRAQLRAYTKIYSLRGIKPGADKVPLDADIMLTVLERGTELLDNVTTAGGPFDPDTHAALVRVAHAVWAFATYTRHDTITVARFGDIELNQHGVTFTWHKLKIKRADPPKQQFDRSSYQLDPVEFIARYHTYLGGLGYSGANPLFGPRPGVAARPLYEDLVFALQTSDAVVQSGLTGHSVRVGAASAAASIFVPLHKIAERMIHLDVKSSLGYIRSYVRPSTGAVAFFGTQSPSANGSAVSVFSARLESKQGSG